MEIKDDSIYLKAYKYNKVFIDETFPINTVKIDLQIASTSPQRGKSYKMVLGLNGRQIIQYPLHGWDKKKFDSVIASFNSVMFK